MASDTATTTRKRKRRWALGFSRLSRQILLANMAGLLVLVAGVLVLDQMREGLIDARIANLRAQGELIAGVLEETATVGAPTPKMDANRARSVMNGLFLSDAAARVQLFDARGQMITDSDILRDQVRVDPLDPVVDQTSFRTRLSRWLSSAGRFVVEHNPFAQNQRLPRRTRSEEIATALLGEAVAGERVDENGERVVSVSVPVQHVVAVLGVVTIESSDVNAIIAAEREALIPFIIVAVLVTLASSLTLTFLIARPIRSLALAADRIRRGGVRRSSIPDLSSRRDEIGDLSKSLESMTSALYERLDAIESFAADVSHEIKN
ncbi:Sensor histidine kinase ChvG, partial [hydrothermal vent metagenome]